MLNSLILLFGFGSFFGGLEAEFFDLLSALEGFGGGEAEVFDFLSALEGFWRG